MPGMGIPLTPRYNQPQNLEARRAPGHWNDGTLVPPQSQLQGSARGPSASPLQPSLGAIAGASGYLTDALELVRLGVERPHIHNSTWYGFVLHFPCLSGPDDGLAPLSSIVCWSRKSSGSTAAIGARKGAGVKTEYLSYPAPWTPNRRARVSDVRLGREAERQCCVDVSQHGWTIPQEHQPTPVRYELRVRRPRTARRPAWDREKVDGARQGP